MATKTFSELAWINPPVRIDKGTEHQFVAMEDVIPGRRYVSGAARRRFTGGGARFQTGDTLFARITPCLENGKIAQFAGAPGEVGFGSTEFFVFRHKESISDSSYIFYLALTDLVRKPAEKSMKGASGRQRADTDSIKDVDVPAPPLPIQRKIAAVLSAYDDLIENNMRRIQVLEEMAQAIYREWFVHFRFPGHEHVRMVDSALGPVPEGWEVMRLGDVIELAYGKALKADERHGGPFPVYGSAGIVGYHDVALVKGPGIIVGRKGNVGSVHWSEDDFYPIDTVFFVRTSLSLFYCYYNLREQHFFNTDAAVPGLNRSQAYRNPLLLPKGDIVACFDGLIAPMFRQIKSLQLKNANLRQTLDLLLPRLVSGEVDVSALDIKTEEPEP